MILEQLVRQPVWRRHAACAGRVELFYATDALSERIALSVCEACGVRDVCLDEAMAEERLVGAWHGVRGGRTPGERRALT